MSSKQRRRFTTAAPPTSLAVRIRKAQSEGRFQTALDLARQLHKQEPTPEHFELLKAAVLGRGRQLRETGATRDAQTVLANALQLDAATPAWLAELAVEFARCGNVRQALDLQGHLPDDDARQRLRHACADASIEQGTTGVAKLPDDLRPDAERVLSAFRLVEAGADDAARESLQGIGLRSPFLEWKLLLRGLLAYYACDDAKALENWQRLDPQRLPARLAAPFRWRIDPAFRTAQSATIQSELERQFDRLQGSSLVQPLRELRKALSNRTNLAAAYRLAETVVPLLRQQAPALLPRLARCFYWTILDSGPHDIERHRRVFGSPPDDPHYRRLAALAYEKSDQLDDAHSLWQAYDADLETLTAFPEEQRRIARGLIWQRLGRNALLFEEMNTFKPPDYPFYPPPRGRSGREVPTLEPDAEACFRKSLTFAPELVETYDDLVERLGEEKKFSAAVALGKKLLKRDPNNAAMLEKLGAVCRDWGKLDESLDYLERARQANPLRRELRSKVSLAHLMCAREAAVLGQIASARPHYQAALALDANDQFATYARWAAAELKANEAEQAEELLQKARAATPSTLPVAFIMLVEASRLKLPKPLKQRFEQEVADALAAPPDPAAAVQLADIVAALVDQEVTYTGFPKHLNLALAYLKRAVATDFAVEQMERIAAAIVLLKRPALLKDYVRAGRKRFPASPIFPLLEVATLSRGGRPPREWEARPLLELARRLTEALPAQDPRRELLLPQIDQQLQALVSPLDFLGHFFGTRDDFDDDSF